MATIVKKKKRVLRVERLAALLFFVSFTLNIGSSLLLRTYNNMLSAQQQSISREIAVLQNENDTLKNQVQTLSTRDRVTDIAAQEGMTQNQGNIVTINKAGE